MSDKIYNPDIPPRHFSLMKCADHSNILFVVLFHNHNTTAFLVQNIFPSET
jgi:hypothetical protein